MPHVSFFQDIENCKAAIVKYSISQNEDIRLCYSLECKHGPSIQRDGKGPPRMSIFKRPWETTTDPLLQRAGTWFIKPKLKDAFLESIQKRLKDLSSGEAEKGKLLEQFKDTNDYYSHYFPLEQDRDKIIGLQSFGDLTMNLWIVAFVNSIKPDKPPELLFLGEECINERIYSCLVKWKEDATDSPESEKGKKLRISVENLHFVRYVYDANPEDPGVVKLVRLNKCIADQIEFAVSGQTLIRDGKLIQSREIVHQFSDIRHLLTLPNLNPVGPLFKSQDEKLDGDRPRYFFGYEQQDDVWFGEAQLLEDRNLRRAALNGPIELSRLYEGLGVSEEQVTAALNYRTIKDGNGGFVSEPLYKEGHPPPIPLRKGEWRFVIDDRSLIEVWLKPNIYPCSILGIDTEGDILCFAWRGNYTTRPGYTIEEAAQTLLEYGGRDAILLDEGNDVRHECFDQSINEWREIVVDKNNREQIRAVFVFTKR